MNNTRLWKLSLIFAACWTLTGFAGHKATGPETEVVIVREIQPAAQKEIALEAARLLRDRYVYETIGMKYADRLAATADLPGETMTAEALATSLTNMLQSIQPDKHLKVLDPARARSILAMFGMLENDGDDEAELEPGAGHHAMAVEGGGFGRVERFAGNIAYVEITMFASGPSAFVRAEEIMASVQDAAAIVFDLRGNGGGDGEMVEKIEAYLFAKPTHIMSSIRRDGPAPTQGPAETWTTTNQLSETMSSIPIFILVGGLTGSAAEAFAFGIKHVDRATVIGQPTAGAGHRVTYERLPHGFALGLPVAAAINPKTGRGWEGVGVIPNVKTATDATLEVLISIVREQL
ncbi:MAG: S41 family peptidase [Gammaproteobacteria bacterium]|nr:S41 family peptidase [Gammaproteobacteria bacterium]